MIKRERIDMLKQQSPQRGSTLITALIMLVLLTLIAVSAINSTSSGIQIVGNAQHHQEAIAVAQQAIEKLISDPKFALNPVPAPVSISMNNNGTPDYTVTLSQPVCSSSIALSNAVVVASPNVYSSSCLSTAGSPTGIVSAAGVVGLMPSNCFLQSWETQATVVDLNGGGSTTVHEGVSLLQPLGGAPCSTSAPPP